MNWTPFKFIRKQARRRPIRKSQRLRVEELETRLAPSANVLTFHNDIASTGLNPNETQLTPTNVKVGSFGKLFVTSVDGQVYAEPLVDTGVTIANGVNTKAGAAGVHDVVFVATQHDSLYAINSANGVVLWQRTFLDLANPGGNVPGGDMNTSPNTTTTALSSVPSGDTNSADISPEIGITGTPVIDPSTNLLYVVVKTKETIGGTDFYVQRLHAINISDGTDAAAPALIGETTNGNTNTTSIYVYGSGDGNVTDPYNGTGQPVVQFNALREHERGALNLVNNQVYVEWASHGDNGPYHGWVVVWNIANVKTSGFTMTGVLCTSPNNGLSGIWQGGGRLAFEADGSAFYFESGNGSGGAPTLNASGFPSNANYNEALVKVVADTQFTSPPTSPTTQNPNGWGLKVADYFIPYNVNALDGADSDFGSGAPLLLPDSVGLPGHPHLMVAAGKEGKIYLVDRDNLGHFDPNNDHVLNAVPDGSGHNTPPVQLSGSLSTAAFFNGTIYWVSGYNSTANAYIINSNGTLSVTSQTAIGNFGSLPGSVIVSANGTTNGIAWVMDRQLNQIHAYDASTFATELWNSGQKAGGGDNLGAVIKFAVPTVANGQVYVGTNNSLVVYGLVQPANAVPDAPVLSAATLSGTSINLTWTDSTAPPNIATSYKIEQSTDNVSFTQVATAPSGATSIAIGGLNQLTTYYFRIRGSNGMGDSSYSNTASATTTSQVALLDFSAGFAGTTSQLTYNGSAKINGSRAELTDGGSGQAGSFFSTTSVDVTKFTTQFTFQLTAADADGFTFCIQSSGNTALGGAGGDLGYTGITPSVAVKFDLYNNAGEGVDSTGLFTNGAAPTVPATDLTLTGIDLHSGDTFQVNMVYDGTTLAVTIKDTVTGATATQNYTINIPTTLGGTLAYVGFTGGTGGLTAIQDILVWTYSPSAATSPNAPSGLGAVPASATSVTLNWTNNATNQTGFQLDRATDSGFTQNRITQNLPATPNSFTDTATGLAPGNTFYYRLRAYNAAGDSGNSNTASAFIPLAPPKPTNQKVTGVTTTEIDMSWQDNAGHQADGYKILRAINHGTFSQVATLPPTSRTPPSTYLWADTNLTPGSFYEYHILAYNVSGNNDFAGVNATTITLPPSGVMAIGGSGVVNLSWTAPTGAQRYNIYRSTISGGEGTTPLVTGVTTTTYADTAVAATTTYYYTITAVNANTSIVPVVPSESGSSGEASATTAPIAPTNLSALAGTSQIALTWAASTNATSYSIYRSTTSGAEASPALATGLTGTSYTDTGVTNGTTYYYVVTAVLSGAESGRSNEALATPPGVATQLQVAGFPSPATAGTSYNFTVSALDAFGHTEIGYAGTVTFTSSAANVLLPANYTFTSGDAGVHTFSAILRNAGTQSITANDTTTPSIAGIQTGIVVNPAATHHLVLSRFPTWTIAGVVQTFRVTAQDLYGNTTPSFADTVTFSSSDAQSVLPANYTFTSGDAGIHTFSATLKTAGIQSITVQDFTNSNVFAGTRPGIQVRPAAASTLQVSGFPSSVTAGTAHNFTVTAFDPYGNIATGYRGTVTFSSTDSQAMLPANYPLTSGDAGAHTFPATLNTQGTQSITAADTINAGLTGTESGITVISVQPTAGISGPSIGVPGQSLVYTLSASESGLSSGTTYSYSVQWGDGSVQTLSGISGTLASHIFTTPGGYTISLTVTDPNGHASVPASTSVSISTVAMETDPSNSSLTALYVGGTPGNDTIAITPVANGGVMVGMNFVNYGSFFPTGHVVVYSQGGNDIIKTAAQTINGVLTYVNVPVLFFAGNGNDILNVTGSSANNVLVGGGGTDRLLGGQGRDILIGGSGQATLQAGVGDDILIGGTTAYDNNAAALAAISAEWTRTDIDYATRIAHLNGSMNGGLNGTYLLNAGTVHGNGLADNLYGGPGMDWFFAGMMDVLFNKTTGEVVTPI